MPKKINPTQLKSQKIKKLKMWIKVRRKKIKRRTKANDHTYLL